MMKRNIKPRINPTLGSAEELQYVISEGWVWLTSIRDLFNTDLRRVWRRPKCGYRRPQEVVPVPFFFFFFSLFLLAFDLTCDCRDIGCSWLQSWPPRTYFHFQDKFFPRFFSFWFLAEWPSEVVRHLFGRSPARSADYIRNRLGSMLVIWSTGTLIDR